MSTTHHLAGRQLPAIRSKVVFLHYSKKSIHEKLQNGQECEIQKKGELSGNRHFLYTQIKLTFFTDKSNPTARTDCPRERSLPALNWTAQIVYSLSCGSVSPKSVQKGKRSTRLCRILLIFGVLHGLHGQFKRNLFTKIILFYDNDKTH